MKTSLEKRKQTRAQTFEHLRTLMKSNLGSHKRTTLRRAGCVDSRSLLDPRIAKEHSELLRRDFQDRFEQAPSTRPDQLRFLTILHAVTNLDATAALRAASEIEQCIIRAFNDTGARYLGAIEVEIVNLAMLRRIGSLKDDETRKLGVLERLTDGRLDTGVLIHFHGVVDLSNSLLQSDELRERLLTIEQWRRSDFQVQLKAFYGNRTLAENLSGIATYITKGGNDTLRYNLGFGRDLPEDLDAKIWKSGDRADNEEVETVTDERSLTLAEVALLNQIWVELMIKRQDNRGYLIELG